MKHYSILAGLLCIGTLISCSTLLQAAPKSPVKKQPAQSIQKVQLFTTIKFIFTDSTLFKPGASIVVGNSDQRIPLDTGFVTNGEVKFNLPTNQDLMYLQIAGKKVLEFFTDGPEVAFRIGRAIELVSSGPLNLKWQQYNREIRLVLNEYYKPETSEQAKKVAEEQYNKITNETFEANKTNSIGIALLGGIAYDLNMRQLDSLMAQVPGSKNSQSVSRIRQSKKIEYNTRPGVKFSDFKARNTENTKAVALSEIVGKGKYVLADFWASWCGPCRHEFPYIRKAHELYKDKGLVVLGVNVWDKYPAFAEGISKFDMTWNHIYASENRSATDTYGIAGIPHIILFGPDGTIIARGLRGEQMLEKLAAIFK